MSRQTTWGRAARFVIIGGAAFAVDVAVFNGLAHAPGRSVLGDAPLVAKMVSTLASAVVSFYGNKVWTFHDHVGIGAGRQLFAFIWVNGIAWGINLAPLAFSRYVLGLDSVVADNVAGSVVGLAAAIIFRFWAYGRWVFPAR